MKILLALPKKISKAFKFQNYGRLATEMDADGNWKIRSIDDQLKPLCVRFGLLT